MEKKKLSIIETLQEFQTRLQSCPRKNKITFKIGYNKALFIGNSSSKTTPYKIYTSKAKQTLADTLSYPRFAERQNPVETPISTNQNSNSKPFMPWPSMTMIP
jgi:hypothetical protein